MQKPDLRNNEMMKHLMDALDAGTDIGHYGRLTFAMVARHFMEPDELVEQLTKDKDFSDDQARVMVQQVIDRDYSPPRAERIRDWQAEQEFPIIPNDDPDAANLYRDLKFPDHVYEHIEHYREEKMHAS
jgi:DNA primase large subunit